MVINFESIKVKSSVLSIKYFTLLPEYFLAVCCIYTLIVCVVVYKKASLNPEDDINYYQKPLSNCLAVVCFMSCYLVINEESLFTFTSLINDTTFSDYLSFFSKACVCFFSGFYFLFIADTLKDQLISSFEYLLILIFCLIGLLLLCSSNDFLTIYLALEMSGLALTVAVAARKDSIHSVENGVTYFIVNAIASSILLLSISYIHYMFGPITLIDCYDFSVTNHDEITHFLYYPLGYISILFGETVWQPVFPYNLFLGHYVEYLTYKFNYFHYNELKPRVIWLLASFFYDYDNSLAFLTLPYLLIFLSLSIKLGLAPFYVWSIDVYEGAPINTSFFLGAISKLGLFVLLVRFYSVTVFMVACNDTFKEYLFLMGFLSVFVGAFGGLKQKKLKSLLAYSSLSHMGYAIMMLGIDEHCIEITLFYMITYVISSFCTWPVLLFTRLKTKTTHRYVRYLGDIALLNKSNKSLAFVTSVAMFSLAGIPPLLGFYAKFTVLMPLILSYHFFIVFFILLFSVVSSFYYLRVIKIMYFENSLVGNLYYPLKSEKTLILSGFALSLIFFFY